MSGIFNFFLNDDEHSISEHLMNQAGKKQKSFIKIDQNSSFAEVITEFRQLYDKVEKLTMLCESFWIALKENTNYTDEDLKEIVSEVELKHEQENQPKKCPVCNQPLQRNKNVCIYCGAKIELDKDLFE